MRRPARTVRVSGSRKRAVRGVSGRPKMHLTKTVISPTAMSRYSQTACRALLAALMAVLLVVVLMTISLAAAAQQNPRRLVLKDGSYQAVTQWEVVKDRVRYYSAERFAWEELPKDLIDWPGTEKFNKERAEPRAAAPAAGPPEEEERHPIDQAEAPTCLPGLGQRAGEGGVQRGRDSYRPSLGA